VLSESEKAVGSAECFFLVLSEDEEHRTYSTDGTER